MRNLITYVENRRLIARFQRGDGAAFDTLYETYAPRVLAFALPLAGGCPADAEDLVQETFLAAFQVFAVTVRTQAEGASGCQTESPLPRNLSRQEDGSFRIIRWYVMRSNPQARAKV